MKRSHVAFLLAVLAPFLLFGYLRLRGISRQGTGLVAQEVCGCVFVAGRAEDACRNDLIPDVDRVAFAVDRGAGSVRAWVPLVMERVATHRPGLGCTLDAP